MSSENALTAWPPRFVFEVALGVDSLDELLAKYSISKQAFAQWENHPTFIQSVAESRKQIRDNGVSFREKAKIQAEDLLLTSYELAINPQTPSAVRANIIQWTAKVAGLEPAQSPAANTMDAQNPEQLKELLRNMGDGDLEVHVMRILKKSGAPMEKIIDHV